MKTTIKLAFLLLSIAILATGQSDANLEQGIKAFGSYQGSEIDSVGLSNGNLILHIPLFSLPQRGKVSLSFTAINRGKNWYVKTTQAPGQPQPTYRWTFRDGNTFASVGHGVNVIWDGTLVVGDRKSTRLNSSHIQKSRMPSSA